EPDVTVRSQLASTAQRLPAAVALAIIGRLMRFEQDAGDPHLPLLLWWAVERHAVGAMNDVVRLFSSREAWKSRLAKPTILPRLVRRLAAEGTAGGLAGCAKLLASAPGARERDRLLGALDEGLLDAPAGKRQVPAELSRLLAGLWKPDTRDVTLLGLLVRLGN